jgi:hypothetical protein
VEYHFNYAFSLKLLGQIYARKQGLSAGKPYFQQSYQLFQTLYAKTQTPKYYQEMREMEEVMKFQQGCLRFLFFPIILLAKIPFIKKKLLKLREWAMENIKEEYKNQ